jgi:membrane-associated phospholipid phosphatase
MFKLIPTLKVMHLCILLLALLLIPSGILICIESQEQSFLHLNQFHNGFMDFCFLRLTYLGDGLFSIFVAAAIMAVWRDKQLALEILLAFLISGILAQIIKHAVGAPRPKVLLNPATYHYFFAGITNSGWNSFPSGHTTSIFALATILVLHLRNALATIGLFLMAVLVGFSRIYLGQHFLIDVFAGAILGIVTAFSVFAIVPANLFKPKPVPYFERD